MSTFRLALAPFLVFGILSAATVTGDLSGYRSFRLGTDLPAIAKLADASPSEAKTICRRPALIQELEWRPQRLTWTSKVEAVQEVIFRFYDGELFQIEVNYDQFATEGLTTDDVVEAISGRYGVASKPPAQAKLAVVPSGDLEEVVARWQDNQYRFELIRSSYASSFRLVGTLKRLEAPAQAAIVEAKRLDDQEAPQREAAQIASAERAARVTLEKARLANKPNFQP